MNKKELKEDLRRGLGSAVLFLENAEDLSEYKEIVLWACLHYTGYDWISEGSRAPYLYYAVSLCKDDAYFEKAISEKFSAGRNRLATFDQLAALLEQFAENGSESARETLYAGYEKLFGFVAGGGKIGARRKEGLRLEKLCVQLLFLDRFAAFEKITADLGAYYRKNGAKKDPFETDWFLCVAKDLFGEKRTERVLYKNKIPRKQEKMRCAPAADIEEKIFSAYCEKEENIPADAHDYAVELLRKNENAETAIRLLRDDFHKGDGELIAEYIGSLKITYGGEWHGIFSEAERLAENNAAAPKELLFCLYKRTLCSFCRFYTVKAMAKRRMITPDFLEELLCDSNADIRSFAEQMRKRREKAQN